MKRFFSHKHLLGYVAVALVCMMIGSAVTLAWDHTAVAQEGGTRLSSDASTVVTSPFTASVQAVRSSVVGVSNYQKQSTTQYSNPFGNYFGYGFGYGYGNRSGGSDENAKEVEYATGSGVVIASGGYVLTNYHVVEGASSLKVNSNSTGEMKEYDAVLIAYDSDLDIAILQAEDLDLPYVSLGDSDTLQVGDWAICIGNPLGVQFSGTTTAGIVSALNREVTTSTSYDKYGRKQETSNVMIQVDAAINSGNSGGGMFNVNGELMGIPTLKYSGSMYSSASVEGIGMCIPINSAKPLIEKVLSGEVTASNKNQTGSSASNEDGPRMGISIYTVNSSVFDGLLPNGAFISEVEAGSPAEKAGLLPGDIIVEADGVAVNSNTKLTGIISEKKAGDTVSLKVYRVEGLHEVLMRYYNQEGSIQRDEIGEGEYVDLNVTLEILNASVKQ